MNIIKFGYPRRGLQGSFNTFRLGTGLANLKPGAQVELVDARSGKLLKLATVKGTSVGQLDQMAALHAHRAHNGKDHPADQRAELLIASMKRRYPPNRCTETSVVTVIDLETDDGNPLPPPRLDG
jgi:hypothetical protein